MTLKVYVNGQDLGATWVDSHSIQNAVKAYSKDAATFSLRFRSYNYATGATFPLALVGGMPVWFGDRNVVHALDKPLFCGRLKHISGADDKDNTKGWISVTFATPLGELKAIMEYIAFDAATYGNDILRVNRLGVLSALPGWDFTTGVSATPSITFPVAPLYEPLTPYEQKSVEFILNDIASDPGQPGYDPYPVHTRRWWISGRFTDPNTPATGVTWVINYQSAITFPVSSVELKDVKASPSDTSAIYLQGATYEIDVREVIRAIYLAGPRTEPQLVTWQNNTNVNAGHGHITKNAGTDGSWDAGAVSKQRVVAGDWEAIAQTQEFYIGHETFQHDDGPHLRKANTGQSPIDYWRTADTVGNAIGIISQHGAPRLHVGLAQRVWDWGAATCIVRSHFSTNRQGQHLIIRASDVDNLWMVKNTGGDYELIKRDTGTETSIGSCGVTPADGDQIKVSMIGTQFQVYITPSGAPEGGYDLQSTGQSFNQHATKHGVGVDCDATGTSHEARFYDVLVGDVWADKAFGLGTQTSVTSWTDISYGYVFNLNGTVTLNEGGSTVGTDAFTYNDKWRVATALYFDTGSASLQRMVTWDKLPAGSSQWTNLRTRLTGVVAMDRSTHPWFVAFAAKELGATLNNISLRRMYANLFHADPAIYGTLQGEYPASGMLERPDLDTFVKRQSHADAIFEQSARPRITLSCRTLTEFALGVQVPVTNHLAGWVDNTGGGGADTRQNLFVTSVKRVESPGSWAKPKYDLTLADRDYDVDLGGRRHLRTTGAQTGKPSNKGTPTQGTEPTVFYFPDPTGDENYGDTLDIQPARIDTVGGYQDAQMPVLHFAPDSNGVQIPADMLSPGAQYVLRYRTRFTSGPASDWSQSAAFVAPTPPAYNRPYAITQYLGDGLTAITAGVGDEVQIPESGTVIGWSISTLDHDLLGVAVPGDLAVDVLYATNATHRATGYAAYSSVAGTDLPTLTAASARTSNDSTKLTGWTTAFRAGDWVYFQAAASPTPTVKKAAVVLLVQRGNAP